MNKLKNIILLSSIVLLCSCEVATVQTAEQVKTTVILNPLITQPSKLPIAYYADAEELSRIYKGQNGYYKWRYYTGQRFKEALDIVMPSVFENSKPLRLDSQFDYLMLLSSEPSYSNSFGTYSVTLDIDVIDKTGESIFTTSTKSSLTATTANAGDIYLNVYAKAIKSASYNFLNFLGPEKIDELISSDQAPEVTADIRSILGDLKPASSGTGFYLNKQGQIYTANHVVDECMFVEVNRKGVTFDAQINTASHLLDLAVLDTKPDATISAPHLSNNKDDSAYLGQPVFATGFPLASIMADYPSLTMGNVSSLGSLKGGKGLFQFSAPIQPGNSGGPVSDYSGNIIGMATSSLNQAMMLRSLGTTAQNVNFGIGAPLLSKFLDKNNIEYKSKKSSVNFEQASKDAVDYTVQVLCYK